MLIKGVPEQVDFERVTAFLAEIGVDVDVIQEVRFTRHAMHVDVFSGSPDGPHRIVVPLVRSGEGSA